MESVTRILQKHRTQNRTQIETQSLKYIRKILSEEKGEYFEIHNVHIVCYIFYNHAVIISKQANILRNTSAHI